MKKILAVLLFSFCISIPVILPFFHNGYFPTHDGEWAIIRLTDMFRTLRDFQIPARYSGNLNFGYGYPLFNFTYPFPYYLGVILHFFGFGFVNTIKILFAGSVVLSAFFMFLASKLLWKNTWAGIVSSVLYVYLPYRMVDLYVRGSIGESLSFALFPLLFYLAVRLIKKPSFLLISCTAIVLSMLITTHNIMAVLFLPAYTVLALIYAIFENKKAIKPFFISIILGFSLSAFFWIPAIFEKSYILLSQIPIADRNLYFVSFNQLIFPSWGYGIPTSPDAFSYQLGLVSIIILAVSFLSVLAFIIKGKSKNYYVGIAYPLIAFIILYSFLLFSPSRFLWENIPLLSEINYPWIILGILGFLISLLAGFLSGQALGKYLVVFLGIIAIFTIAPYAKPQQYINNPDSYYLTNDATTTSSNELMPLWVKKIPSQRAIRKVEIISGNGEIENVASDSKQVNFSINALTKTNIKINTIYFPGWKIYVDEIDTEIFYDNEQGVMEISIPSGRHIVNAKLKETPLRLASDLISLMSASAIIFLIARGNKNAFI